MKYLLSSSIFWILIFKLQILSATTYTVNSTDDLPDANIADGICADANGNCTLRAAILEATLDFTPAPHTIDFNITGTGVQTIQLTSELPSINQPTIIDGTTQAGYLYGSPQIVIDGSLTPAGSSGFNIQTSGCTIRGLVIGGFTENAGLGGIGVYVQGETNNTIAACFIGIAADGITAFSNFIGIQLEGFANSADNNLIGGDTDDQGNIISHNTNAGIYMFDANNNQVSGNYIGTTATGMVAAGNFCGIAMVLSSFNTIGGTTTKARNLISGNTGGIDLFNGCTNATIQGNYIGSDVAGTAAIPNDWGIRIAESSDAAQIGGLLGSGAGNLISGNTSGGIRLLSDNCIVQGNLIGVQNDFVSPLANGPLGILVAGGTGHTIGGPASGNIIAYHTADGIQLAGAMTGPTPIPTNTIISQNAIFGNAVVGIDLGEGTSDGRTPNDLTDVDVGANLLQNYADMFGASYDPVGDAVSLTYEVIGDAVNLAFPLVVEFFIADANGQGQIFYGSDICTLAEFTANPQQTITLNTPALLAMTGTENLVNTVTDANGNTSEFSFEAVLPLDNLALVGKRINEGIELLWNHEQEDQVSYYTLEKQGKNRVFSPIQEILGIQPSGQLIHLDKTPTIGTNSYRLKADLLDGSTHYSNIVEVQYSAQNLLTAFFNHGGQLNAKLNVNRSASVLFKLIDIQGREISQWNQEIAPGENTIQRTIPGLPRGNYILMIPALGQKVRLVY